MSAPGTIFWQGGGGAEGRETQNIIVLLTCDSLTDK